MPNDPFNMVELLCKNIESANECDQERDLPRSVVIARARYCVHVMTRLSPRRLAAFITVLIVIVLFAVTPLIVDIQARRLFVIAVILLVLTLALVVFVDEFRTVRRVGVNRFLAAMRALWNTFKFFLGR